MVADALREAPTSLLLTTDVGYYPVAAHHGIVRPNGASEAIVIVCLAGLGWCQSGDTRLAVHGGQALVIGPGVPHSYHADPSDPWSIWWLHIAGSAVAPWISRLGAAQSPQLIALSSASVAAKDIAQALTIMETRPSQAALAQSATHAWLLFSTLLRNKIGIAHSGAEAVRLAEEYLRDHSAEQVRVPDVAAAVGMSCSHLTVLFRQTTGTTIVEYLTRLRMARARELLALSTLTVKEVAAAVGYEDPFYFSRRFHDLHGCSPSDFRTGQQVVDVQ
jgi:AraC-like DNA-binding protein